MSALGKKVLDLAEQQGLLDGKAISELRKQVAESKFVITPEAIAKVLVDHGHLTPFQARRLVSQAQGNEPDPVEQRVAEKTKPQPRPRAVEEEDLTFADSDDGSSTRSKKPTPAKPAMPDRRPGNVAPQRPPEKPASVQPPVEGSTADDFVELESIETARPVRGNRWKTDSPEGGLSETVELTPLDLSLPQPVPTPDLAPIDDLFGPEPIPAPAPRRGAGAPVVASVESDLLTPLTPLIPIPRPKKNVWDSPLLLIGGGALGVILVLFAILFYALTRGTAAEMFSKAEEEYRSGSYASAIAVYEKFLRQYPSDANASLARVRRGMATLRQVTDDGKNPRLGLDTAKQILPEIDDEREFDEARGELATILPDIADGFATQAGQTKEGAKKGELVTLAGEALTLVNNPAYLPASLRKDRESHILRIVDKLKAAERGIQQDKDLAEAIKTITGATDKGDSALAYKIHSDLLRIYPGLAADSQLLSAVRLIGEKEKQLVKVSNGGPAPFTNDHAPGSELVVISHRDEGAAAASSGPTAFVLVEGAVYGIDSQSGRVLWRRFVGYETSNQPISLAIDGRFDAVLIDGRRHELVRVKGTTGELVWRQKLSGAAAGPVVAGSRILITTRRGNVVAFEGAGGEVAAAAQLPQGADVAPAVRQSRVYQLGEHSTLFVLDEKTLACTETVYVGHEAGEILVPPVAVLDHVLVVKSPADNYSEIQALKAGSTTKRLGPVGKPQRLKGRIVTPLSVSAGRIAAITDVGQLAVYEADSGGTQEPLRLIAALEASEASPRRAWCDLDRNRLWVIGHRRTLFEVQASLSQLVRRWTENFDDSFVAPLRVEGDTLVLARRRGGESAVLVEGCRAATGQAAVWSTRLAAPVVSLVASEARQAVDSLTADGRLYSLGREQFAARQVERPAAGSGGSPVFPSASLSADGQTLVWTESQSGGRVYFHDVKSGGKPVSVVLPAKSSAAAAPLGGGAIAPLENGSVVFLSRNSAEAKIAPFLPPLSPDALPLWTKAAVLADDKSFLISDGRGTVHAVTKREGTQPQLASVGESKTSGPISLPMVVAGTAVLGVVRQERNDAVAGFDSRAAAAFEPVPLEGRVEAGPFAVGGLVLMVAEPDGLLCIGGDGRVRWQQPLGERGPLAGPPSATSDGDLLVPFQSGVVCRLDAASGKELARHDVGEPLLGPACLFGTHMYIAGSDGVVHRISVPPRP